MVFGKIGSPHVPALKMARDWTKAAWGVIGGYHEDDRAQRLLDVFSGWQDGQLNISYINSVNHVVAWHVHKQQTDLWICIKGSLKVGLAESNDSGGGHTVRFEYLSDKNFRILEIPPGVYHGYKALEPDTILLYYVTRKYDPDDEIRAKVGDFHEKWDTENK